FALDSPPRRAAGRGAAADPRPAAEPDQPSGRLLVPSPLPVCPPSPPRGRPAAGAGARRSGARGRLPAAQPDAEGAVDVSALVEVRGVVKHFPVARGVFVGSGTEAVHAVDGVSFDVRAGET